ncbi:hypothetical protein FPOAC2_05187 [Fusarium poae]
MCCTNKNRQTDCDKHRAPHHISHITQRHRASSSVSSLAAMLALEFGLGFWLWRYSHVHKQKKSTVSTKVFHHPRILLFAILPDIPCAHLSSWHTSLNQHTNNCSISVNKMTVLLTVLSITTSIHFLLHTDP